MDSSMPTCTAMMGPISAPASAASAAPSRKMPLNTRLTRTPISSAIHRSDAPARTSMPTRLWLTSRYNSPATNTPAPSTTRRYEG